MVPGGLLSGGNAHSVWLPKLADIVVSGGHSRWHAAYVRGMRAGISDHPRGLVAALRAFLQTEACRRPEVSSYGPLGSGLGSTTTSQTDPPSAKVAPVLVPTGDRGT